MTTTTYRGFRQIMTRLGLHPTYTVFLQLIADQGLPAYRNERSGANRTVWTTDEGLIELWQIEQVSVSRDIAKECLERQRKRYRQRRGYEEPA